MSCQDEIIKRFCQSKLDHAVYIPNVREKLYIESTKVFQAVQENSNKQSLDVFADRYLNVLKEQIYLVEQYYGPAAIKERHMYLELERVWTLCQVLFFSNANKTDISERLMNWYNDCHKSYLLEFDRQSICYSQSTFNHADFWPYTIRLILLGQINTVSNLFDHVLSEPGFNSYENLRKYIEFIRTLTSKDIQHIRARHFRIKQVLAELNKDQNWVQTKYLEDILHLLMGDEKIILRYTKDNVLALIASKFYRNNQINIPIHEFAQHFFKEHDSKDQSPLRFFLEGNVYPAIELCSNYDWWIITHLSDLLSKKNMLSDTLRYTVENSGVINMDARDFFVLTYGSYLINQFGLWQQSFTYLMTCGELGKSVVLEHLKIMDFQNDDEKLNNVVKFCIDYSMKNDGLVLYEKKATVCLASKNYDKALQYYNQAEKYQYLDQVFNAVLQDFIHTGKLYDIKLFKDTSNYKGVHYLVYRDISYINQLFLNEQFKMAADVFNCLVKNNSIPNLLMPIVFAEGWKLIDRRSNFGLNDLLEMKKIWVKLKNSCTLQDFTWYHYYINSNLNSSSKETFIPKDILLSDMTEFFNSTAVIITRAIDTFDQ